MQHFYYFASDFNINIDLSKYKISQCEKILEILIDITKDITFKQMSVENVISKLDENINYIRGNDDSWHPDWTKKYSIWNAYVNAIYNGKRMFFHCLGRKINSASYLVYYFDNSC